MSNKPGVWIKVVIPRVMYREVEECVKSDSSLYCGSVEDFVAAGVREEIRKARKTLKEAPT